MEAMGTSACRKKITASPPSPTKSGPPRTTAERSRISETAKGAGRKRRPEERKTTAAAVPAPVAARPDHDGDEWRMSLQAMSPNPAGMTLCDTQPGRYGIRRLPPARSSRTIRTPAQARISVIAAETAEKKQV